MNGSISLDPKIIGSFMHVFTVYEKNKRCSVCFFLKVISYLPGHCVKTTTFLTRDS